MTTTVYYCPVVGCSYEHVEPQTQDPAMWMQVTETALTNHVLRDHTLYDFLSSMRSYQTFLKVLSSHLKSFPTGPDVASDAVTFANGLLEIIDNWRKENGAR